MSTNREVKAWFTVNGQHIPIFEGESKSQAVNRYIAEKNEEVKNKQISENKKQADKLNKKDNNKALSKKEQLDIILKANPATDDYHTWIRDESDILTFDEAFKEGEIDPDFTDKDIEKARKSGKVTVYSSKPIQNGNFISPSAMEAASYAGGEAGIYKAIVNLSDVAWIDNTQGQLATKNKIKFNKISSKGLI